jgi:hypothetical protein
MPGRRRRRDSSSSSRRSTITTMLLVPLLLVPLLIVPCAAQLLKGGSGASPASLEVEIEVSVAFGSWEQRNNYIQGMRDGGSIDLCVVV